MRSFPAGQQEQMPGPVNDFQTRPTVKRIQNPPIDRQHDVIFAAHDD